MSDIEKTSSASEKDHRIVEPSDSTSFIDEKKMFKKVDWNLLPIMMITYSMQFMDKLALSNSSVFGIRTDLHLVGQDYSWASSVFFFGFLLGNFIVSAVVRKVRIGKFVGGAVFLWGIALTASAGCQSYGALVAARFFLGLLESCVSPTFVFMTSVWWKRSQQPARTGLWFAGNDIGGIVGGFLSFGLGHITGNLNPWRYIFMVYGLLAFFWSFVILFYLPDSPQKAKFLTEDEKEFYRTQMVESNIEHNWNWEQAKECAYDLNIWLLLLATFLCICPNSGMISYGLIILRSFDFTSLETTLLNLPASVIAWIGITLTGYLASRFKNQRTKMMIYVTFSSIIGGCLCYKGATNGVKLVGYFFLQLQPAIFTHILSMAASNFHGSTRRSIVNSSIFIVYCVGNISGPQLFRSSDAPKYSNAFLSWVICYCLTILFAVLIAAKFIFDNKKQASKEQVPLTSSSDIAEYHDPTFRYMY